MKFNVELYPEQLEFLESKALYTCFSAGYGSGKSFVLTLKTILFKLKYPKVRVAYYLPTFPLVRDIAFQAFPEMLDEMGLDFSLNKSTAEIEVHGYGTIIFRSMMNPENIVGYQVGHSFIDEADILPKDKMQTAFEKILSRNRQVLPDKEPNRISVASTPEGYRFMYNQFVEEPIKSSKLIFASSYSNKFLPEGYIDVLKNQYSPELVKAYINGEFVNMTSGTVYEYFKRDLHHCTYINPTESVTKSNTIHGSVTKSNTSEENPHLHIGVDFNVGACAMSICIIEGEVVQVINEHAPKDTFQMVKFLDEKYRGRRITLYPDASGTNSSSNAEKSNIQILEDAGYICDVANKNPLILDRVNLANNMFSKNLVKIDTDKAPKLTSALEKQAWDEKTGKPEKSGEPGSPDDYTDSFTYFLYRKFNPAARATFTQRRMV